VLHPAGAEPRVPCSVPSAANVFLHHVLLGDVADVNHDTDLIAVTVVQSRCKPGAQRCDVRCVGTSRKSRRGCGSIDAAEFPRRFLQQNVDRRRSRRCCDRSTRNPNPRHRSQLETKLATDSFPAINLWGARGGPPSRSVDAGQVPVFVCRDHAPRHAWRECRDERTLASSRRFAR